MGGGDAPSVPAVPAPSQPETQLAANEQADFERAQAALASGDFRAAADQFATFNQTYPGGPLTIEATLRRGEALEGLGDVREGARAYLASFTLDPTGTLRCRGAVSAWRVPWPSWSNRRGLCDVGRSGDAVSRGSRRKRGRGSDA